MKENAKKKRIVFMGTPEFAANILEGLVNEGYKIVLAVCQPDREVGRKRILTPPPVKETALKYGIPVFQPLKIRNDYEKVFEYDPELIIVSAYGQILPEIILEYPEYGCINTHGSLLPKYRGGSPIQRAIINGEKKTGMTVMYMSRGMDEGDILKQEELEIDIDDTNATLFKKMSDLALRMLLEFLPDFFEGNFTAVKQDENEVSYAWNLKKEDEYINFDEDCMTVYNHIRGLLDNPGAYSVIEGRKYKFHKVSFKDEDEGRPGEVLGLRENRFQIACLKGKILVEEIQPEGKGVMSARDFYNGAGRNLTGKCFEAVHGTE